MGLSGRGKGVAMNAADRVDLLETAKRLCARYGVPGTFIDADVADFLTAPVARYDFVLCLSIFHHLLDRGKSYKAIDLAKSSKKPPKKNITALKNEKPFKSYPKRQISRLFHSHGCSHINSTPTGTSSSSKHAYACEATSNQKMAKKPTPQRLRLARFEL